MLTDLRRMFLRRRLDQNRHHWWPAAPTLFTPRFSLGAAVLVHDAQERLLLVRQTYAPNHQWLPPGGWVHRGETPQQAAAREFYEEVGLRVAIVRPLAIRTGGYGEIAILFEGHLLAEATIRLSAEIAQANFFSLDALPPVHAQTWQWLADGLAVRATFIRTDRTTPDER